MGVRQAELEDCQEVTQKILEFGVKFGKVAVGQLEALFEGVQELEVPDREMGYKGG